ncbi:MAG: sulfotransferase, partial [Gammaproteobacteria bacterium]|nr:sulfotransferase [Gammaproteobacteria bacterium]
MSNPSQQFYREISDLIRSGQAVDAISKLEAGLAKWPGDEICTSLLGSALMRTGRHTDAIALLQNAAERKPTFATIGDLGVACMEGGDIDGAIAAFRRAVDLRDDFYHGWCFLSRMLFERGELDDATAAFRRADACDPLLNEFRNVQEDMSASRFAAAEKRCKDLLKRQPGYPRAAYTLAHLGKEVGAFEEAGDILRRAIAYNPCDVNLRSALVGSLEESGAYAEAVTEAEIITSLDGENAASWLILGRVHGHCGNYEDSLASYDGALELTVDDAQTRCNVQLVRGHILKILGRHDDSIAAYRDSMNDHATAGAGWWGLADMKTHRFDDADIDSMQALFADDSVRIEQRTQAAFALGKAFEDRDEPALAFDWYAKANEIRVDTEFDPDVQQRGLDEIIATYDPSVLSVQADPPPDGPTPIFIVGLPRSGSTLLEQILASHSRVEGTMELATLPNLVRRITIEGGRRKLNYPSSITAFEPGELTAWGQSYIDDTAMYRGDKPYFIDKLPTNFDKIGLIHKILPQAMIIDARRHPLDCGFSCFKQHFAGGHLWSYKLEHIAAYYNEYLRLMDHWDRV